MAGRRRPGRLPAPGAQRADRGPRDDRPGAERAHAERLGRGRTRPDRRRRERPVPGPRVRTRRARGLPAAARHAVRRRGDGRLVRGPERRRDDQRLGPGPDARPHRQAVRPARPQHGPGARQRRLPQDHLGLAVRRREHDRRRVHDVGRERHGAADAPASRAGGVRRLRGLAAGPAPVRRRRARDARRRAAPGRTRRRSADRAAAAGDRAPPVGQLAGRPHAARGGTRPRRWRCSGRWASSGRRTWPI